VAAQGAHSAADLLEGHARGKEWMAKPEVWSAELTETASDPIPPAVHETAVRVDTTRDFCAA
jgi:hypothetical protein